MPTVIADNRTLYSGPSLEDAELVMELARELGAYSRAIYFRPGGTGTPTGLVGKALLQADEREKRRAVSEALKEYRRLAERLKFRRGFEGEPSPVPPKAVVRNLLAASVSDDFDEARREWEYSGEILEETDPNFSRECQLCGPKELMRANYVIRNVRTGKTLRVGSVCVKRFLVLAGTSSADESAALFDRRTALALFGQSQGRLIADLGRDEVPERSLVALLGALEKAFPGPLSREDARIAARAAGAGERAARVFEALAARDGAALRALGLKVRKMHDGEERKRKVRDIFLTLARSSEYRDPQKQATEKSKRSSLLRGLVKKICDAP